MSIADPRELLQTFVGDLRISLLRFVKFTIWGRIFLYATGSLVLLDIVRFFALSPDYQTIFTDGFEMVIVLVVTIACSFAAARSSKLTRGLWALTAAYFTVNIVADFHDLLVDNHFTGTALLNPLEFIGWFVYLPLALLIFYPISENGHLRWKWLPVIDFAQVALAISLANFRLIYLHHLDIRQGWTEYGWPELIRNVLISVGLLFRARVEPSARARAIYWMIGGAFATITFTKIPILFLGYGVNASAVIRPALFLVIGAFAASWNDRSVRESEPARSPDKLQLALSMFAGITLIGVLFLADDAPDRYRGVIYLTAAAATALFVLRSSLADYTRRVTQDGLRASEQRYRLLFEKTVAAVGTTNMEGQVLDCNEAWARMHGYDSVTECRGSQIAERYFDPTEREVYLKELQATGIAVNRKIHARRKDGTPFWILLNSVLFEESRRRTLIQSTAVEITARKQAEEALRQSEERFRIALKDSPTTVFNQDMELRYTWIYNHQFYWLPEILGKTNAEILGKKEAAGLTDLTRRVLQAQSSQREEVMITYGGKKCAFDITIEPLFDADKKMIGIAGCAVNIARLRELADSLKEAKERLLEEKLFFQSEIQAELGFEKIIGQSSVLKDVLKEAQIVAATDSNVLVLGETGTGKELVARAIHSLSSRRNGNFITLNCAAVPTGLLESELFGHEKGAFTSATSQKVGRLELADKGTMFLDEIADLPLELQPKLLRVLQDREFERLGGVRTLRVDVRIISATNCDLKKEVVEKRFREDLFYRLNVFPIHLPPLRERQGDIPLLVHHFVHKHAVRMGKHIDTVPEETLELLQNWSWPGNVRELENMIERMVILTNGRTLATAPMELEAPQLTSSELASDDNLLELKRGHIVRVLQETNGMLSGPEGAAQRLGIKRTTLQSMMKRYGIEPQEYRRRTGT